MLFQTESVIYPPSGSPTMRKCESAKSDVQHQHSTLWPIARVFQQSKKKKKKQKNKEARDHELD